MLTLLETVAAIEALDTSRDVILSACIRIAKPMSASDDMLDTPDDIIRHINATYQHRCDPAHLMMAAADLAGAAAGILAKPGHEGEAVQGIQELMINSFRQAMTHRFTEMMKTDPAKAMAMLRRIVDQVRKKEQE